MRSDETRMGMSAVKGGEVFAATANWIWSMIANGATLDKTATISFAESSTC